MANLHVGGLRAALLSRVDGDEEIFGELCDIFLDDAPKRLAMIRAALQARDAAGLRAAAHAFKGAAGVFGADASVAAARTLEQMGADANLEGAETVLRELEIVSRLLLDEVRAVRGVRVWKS